MSEIILWETHCDTIGDIFQNKHIQRFLQHWYKTQNKWKTLKISWRNDIFSWEFEDFVRKIFSDRDRFEEFLSEIRAKFLLEKKFLKHLKKNYETEDFIVALLCFQELNYILEEGNRYTMQGVFSTQIREILENRKSGCIHNEDSEEWIYETIPAYFALEKALNYGMLPISESGDIFGAIQKQADNVHYIVSSVSEGSIFEVDQKWRQKEEQYEATRKDILQLVTQLQEIYEYYQKEGTWKLSPKNQKLFDELNDEYDILSQNATGEIPFETFLENKIKILEEDFPQARIADHTHIKKLLEKGKFNSNGTPVLYVVSSDNAWEKMEKWKWKGKGKLRNTSWFQGEKRIELVKK